jgi:hypothetical protein
MSKPRFDRLKLALLEGGVAPRYVQRTILELEDHYADIANEAIAAGLSAADAAAEARAALGSEESIARAVIARTELRDWVHRWPRAAHCVKTAVLLVLLPVVPVVYCAHRGPSIVRWSISASLALFATSALLLGMQWLVAH